MVSMVVTRWIVAFLRSVLQYDDAYDPYSSHLKLVLILSVFSLLGIHLQPINSISNSKYNNESFIKLYSTLVCINKTNK